MILRIYKGIVCSILIAMALLVLLSIFSRYIGRPLQGAEELLRYMFISMVFLSLGLIVRSDADIRFDSVLISLPKKIQNVLLRIINGTCTLFYGITSYSAIITIMRNLETRTPTTGMLFIFFALPATVGFILITIESFIKTVAPSKPGEDQLKNAKGNII